MWLAILFCMNFRSKVGENISVYVLCVHVRVCVCVCVCVCACMYICCMCLYVAMCIFCVFFIVCFLLHLCTYLSFVSVSMCAFACMFVGLCVCASLCVCVYFLRKLSYYIFESSETCISASPIMGISSEDCSSLLALGLVSTGCTALTAGGFLGLAWLVVMYKTGRLTIGYLSGRKRHPAALTKWLLQTLVLPFIGRLFLPIALKSSAPFLFSEVSGNMTLLFLYQ